MSRNIRALALACVFSVGGAAGARADDCKPLALVSHVQMVPSSGKTDEFVPVTIEGHDGLLLLDTGSGFSNIAPQAVKAWNLSTRESNIELTSLSNETSDRQVDVADFNLGSLAAHGIPFLVSPGNLDYGDAKVVGALGANILTQYDLGLDFGADTLDLLSQDHCEGKVIYWPASAVSVVPFRNSRLGNDIMISVVLDGKTVMAELDTGSEESSLTLPAAESDFGLKPGSPDMPYVADMEGRPGASVYRHTFSTLDFNGIAVGHLKVQIIPDLIGDQFAAPPETGSHLTNTSVASATPDMLIGMDVLRHLHIYIAYKEKKLYVTPAEKPAPQPAQPARPAGG